MTNKFYENIIYHLFEEQLHKSPNHPAVFDESRQLTRKELEQLTNTIAAQLPNTGRRFGIVMDHSVEPPYLPF